MSVEIKRTNNKQINVETSAASNRITVGHILWLARELEQAVEEGLPQDAEVQYHNTSGVTGVRFNVRHVIVQDIP